MICEVPATELASQAEKVGVAQFHPKWGLGLLQLLKTIIVMGCMENIH